MCLAWFKNQKPIRGEEIKVEIDDILITRRNYERERGRVLSQIWLFGIIERASKRHFVVGLTSDISEKRDKATLMPLIQNYINYQRALFTATAGAPTQAF